jgi:hypothetical protein
MCQVRTHKHVRNTTLTSVNETQTSYFLTHEPE